MTAQATQSDRGVAPSLPGADGASAAETVQEYDWNCPYRYNPAQRHQLEEFAATAAGHLAAALGRLFDAELAFAPAGCGESFGPGLIEGAGDGPGACHFSLVAGGATGGLLSMPTRTAISWVSRLLGGTGNAEGDRDLSQLERELLADVAVAVVEAFSEASKASGGVGYSTGDLADSSEGMVDAQAACVRFAFRQGQVVSDEGEQRGEDPEAEAPPQDTPDGPPDLFITIESHFADPLAGVQPVARAGGDDGRAALREWAKDTPISGEAVLPEVAVTMRGVLDLEPGDVLVLPDIGDRVQLRVNDELFLRGRLVQIQGRLGLQVAEFADVPPDATDG